MAELIYSPNNFIQTVINNDIIIQDNLEQNTLSLDYTIHSSIISDGTTLIITNNVNGVDNINLKFSTTDNVLSAMNKLITTITQLKNGTYVPKEESPTITTNHNPIDYSEIYKSTNFIKEVINNHIQIQNKEADKVTFSINYLNVTTTLVNNRLLVIYRTNETTISLQFTSNSEALIAHDIFRNTIDQLKDNTFNTYNNIANAALYDPDTFIYTILFKDFSVQLININGKITHNIIAKQVVSVYTSNNLLKVKSEATDTIISLIFESSSDAILAAHNLRVAIKEIEDKNATTASIKSYSQDFDNNIWVLDPDIPFSFSEFNLEYFELVCPTGGTCPDVDLVKRSCRGIVEYDGSIETGILNKVTIRFNQSVKGRAILISK